MKTEPGSNEMVLYMTPDGWFLHEIHPLERFILFLKEYDKGFKPSVLNQ